MENLLLNISSNIEIYKNLRYFSIELVCIAGIILNLLFMPLAIYKPVYKKISNCVTYGTFMLNIILAVFLFHLKGFSFGQNIIIINHNTLFLKLFINIYALALMLLAYKHIKKAKYKLPYLNMIFVAIIMLIGILLTSDNFVFVYILLEAVAILIYQYVSNMQLNKNGVYSPVYIAIGFLATFLFVAFYFMDYWGVGVLQKSIIQTCMVLALLLKIGLFPIFNYTMDKKCLSNIPYSLLLFCLFSFAGVFVFFKIISLCMFNEICQICVMIFLSLCAIAAVIPVFKTKSLSLHLVNVAQIYLCFYSLNIMYTKEFNLKFIIVILCVFSLLYSMLKIYKNNKKYLFLFSLLLILSAFLIPLFGLNMLFNIYTFDKIGFYILNIFVFCNILIIIKTLNILESFYKAK